MRVKEIYVEAKKSKKYQTYTVGLTAHLLDDEDEINCVKFLQIKARDLVMIEIAKDEPELENPYTK